MEVYTDSSFSVSIPLHVEEAQQEEEVEEEEEEPLYKEEAGHAGSAPAISCARNSTAGFEVRGRVARPRFVQSV